MAAESAGRTEQAVNHWLAATRCADSASLLNLARDHEIVWNALCEIAGRAGSATHDSPRLAHAYAVVQQIALLEGPAGEAVRTILRKESGK